MSDQPPVPPAPPASTPPPNPADPSRVRTRRGGVAYSAPQPAATVRHSRISIVWIIPLVAICIAAYLGYRTVSEEGPLVTLTFRSADGLTAGQTQVRHKAVQLGVVETIRLSDDMSSVNVTLRMRKEALPYLTDTARFWVVRPRISSGSLAGIETLVSGGYIEMDPGARDGPAKLQYTGLEQPPGVRYGEPGRTFVLKAERVGSLTAGAPVFWRDVTVGEVLGYDIGNGKGPVTINIFVRAPYDEFVRSKSHFWNASGLSVQVGAAGFHVEVASLQALLSGGVAFDTPQQGGNTMTQAAAGTVFPLFHNYDEAQASGFTTTQAFVTYFESSVRGLAKGASVEFYGIQIGTVAAVTLQPVAANGEVRVRVDLEIQPERVLGPDSAVAEDPVTVARRLVAHGMKAQLQTASYITGQQVLALVIVPGATPGEIVQDGKDLVIPSQGGGLDNILTAVSDMAGKLDRLPLDQIGQNLNGTLRSASGALASVQELVRNANTGLTPLFRRVPEITAALQDAAAKASRTFGSLDNSYGSNSQFQRELERAMTQVGDTARSIRILADFLDRHPEALVRGRAGVADR